MKRKKKRRALLILAVIVIVVLAAAFLAILYVQGMLNKVQKVDSVTDVVARADETFEVDEAEEGEEPEPDTKAPQEIVFDQDIETVAADDVQNILLIGQDRREGQGRQRSDSMVIFSVNHTTNQITMVSLMRDMYVPIPGYSDNRINAAYAFGGMELLDRVIAEDFGVQIDGNIEIDFNSFISAFDTIGNLDIDLKDYEAQHLNAVYGWNLHAGVNSLNSEQLLAYSRVRYVGNADYERTERQRLVLNTAFQKLMGSGLTELASSANQILPSLTTDLSNTDILKLVYAVKRNNMPIRASERIPVDGTFSSERVRGMAVLVPDLKRNSAALKEYLYGAGQE